MSETTKTQIIELYKADPDAIQERIASFDVDGRLERLSEKLGESAMTDVDVDLSEQEALIAA